MDGSAARDFGKAFDGRAAIRPPASEVCGPIIIPARSVIAAVQKSQTGKEHLYGLLSYFFLPFYRGLPGSV